MTLITQSISTFSTNPSKGDDPDVFDSDMDTRMEEEAGHVIEINAWAAQANSLAEYVDTQAAQVSTNLTEVTALKQAAEASANYIGVWSGLTGAISAPASTYHNGLFWMLLSNLTDVTADEPGVSSAWALISTAPSVINKTTSGSLIPADLTGKTITNSGAAGAIDLQWPSLVTGQEAYFFIEAAQYLKITAPAGESFHIGQITTAAGGYIRANTTGQWLRIKVMPSGLTVFEFEGVWLYDE